MYRLTATLIAALSLTVAGTASAAQSHSAKTAADFRQFLVHVNANHPKPWNCKDSTWHSRSALCSGWSAPSGDSYAFSKEFVYVSWCVRGDVGQFCGPDRLEMPHGYVRWMRISTPGESNYLIGAVQMPNGPFHVVGGRINGHAVQPDSGDQGKVGHKGGPLALIVHYTGSISSHDGVPATNGYTFGLVGWVKF
jgi:hypothetical protein